MNIFKVDLKGLSEHTKVIKANTLFGAHKNTKAACGPARLIFKEMVLEQPYAENTNIDHTTQEKA